jgi:putative tryptophan/tyrosine transport system substrate-binding protein
VTIYTRRQVVQGMGAVGVGLLAGCGRWPGQAPQPVRIFRVALLTIGESGASDRFREELRARGYVEGQNLVLDIREAEGATEHLAPLARELIELQPDVIATLGVAATQAARDATSTLPIVQLTGSDLVKLGLAASLARPGGNVTGLSGMVDALVGKRLEFLHEATGGMSRVAVLWSPAGPLAELQLEASQSAARARGLELQSLEVHSADALEGALQAATAAQAGGLLVLTVPLTANSRGRIGELAARNRLPAIFDRWSFVVAGGLMAYGPDTAAMARRGASYVDRILHGTTPADLPVEQPTKFDFVINLRTAQALGLAIPQHVLLQATEVIQ